VNRVVRKALNALGMLVFITVVTAAGFYLLAAIDRAVELLGTPGWTALDWLGSSLTAFVVGFILLSSFLAFLAAVIEGRKLTRKG